MRRSIWRSCTTLFVIAIIAGEAAVWGQTVPVAAGEASDLAKIRPEWHVGDQWIVESKTRPQQLSRVVGQAVQGTAMRWRFRVAAQENVEGTPCFRLEIQTTDKSQSRPQIVLWVDVKNQMPRKFQTQMIVQGQRRGLTESYMAVEGDVSPVMMPLTVLPVDLPAFTGSHDKGPGLYRYQVQTGKATTKNLNAIGFQAQVQQSVSRTDASQILQQLGDEFSKSVKAGPVFKVELKTGDQRVQQFWQEKQPWPVFSDNGQTQARLIRFTRAAGNAPASESVPDTSAQTEGREHDKCLTIDSENRDQGTARFKPWSGYWWPLSDGGLLQPLARYDLITKRNAAGWEQQQCPRPQEAPDWHGFCHAWAASSVMEPEPRTSVTLPGAAPVCLSVGDQKGMLAACHTRDVANCYGTRFETDSSPKARQDLAPDRLWRLLQLYVREQGVPLILDIEAGPEVWNYPVYAYEVEYQPQGTAGKQVGRLTLLMADNAVDPQFTGLKVKRQSYRFSFKLQAGAVVAGSGKWLGRSQNDHPDFAWYPYIAVAENPEIDYDTVRKMVSAPRSRPEGDSGDTPLVAQKPELPANESEESVKLSPEILVSLVAGQTSDFGLDVAVDRFDGGNYEIGDRLQVRCASEKAGYLYLIQIDAAGQTTLLFPQPGQVNRIPAQKATLIPAAQIDDCFRVRGPQGTTRLRAVVVTNPIACADKLKESDEAALSQNAAAGESLLVHSQPDLQSQSQVQQRRSVEQKRADLLPRVRLSRLPGEFAHDEVQFYVDRRQNPAAQKQEGLPQQKTRR